MDAVSRHDIGTAAKDGARALLDVHEAEQIETSFPAAEEKIGSFWFASMNCEEGGDDLAVQMTYATNSQNPVDLRRPESQRCVAKRR